MLFCIVFSKKTISLTARAIMLRSECFTQKYFSKWRVKKLSFRSFLLWKDIMCFFRTNQKDNINNLDSSFKVNEVVSSDVLELWELITDIVCKVYWTFYFFNVKVYFKWRKYCIIITEPWSGCGSRKVSFILCFIQLSFATLASRNFLMLY